MTHVKIHMLKYTSVLKSSNHQFAFKAEHSTSMCTLTLKEIIKNFTNKGVNVYVCLLDASKAFLIGSNLAAYLDCFLKKVYALYMILIVDNLL